MNLTVPEVHQRERASRRAGQVRFQIKAQTVEDRGRDVARFHGSLGRHAAVVQAAVSRSGELDVERIWVAGDVGEQIINPSNAENQVQGAVLDGLSQALAQEITFEGGKTKQSNFNGFELLRMNQAPPVEVHFHITDNQPTGLGQPSTSAEDHAYQSRPRNRGRNGGRVPFRSRLRALKWKQYSSTNC